MKFYCFGDEEKPVILLLPGTCCHWKRNFCQVIPLLEKDFRVVCASYDGFDETENTVFPDMLTETERIEDYIQKNFSGMVKRPGSALNFCAKWQSMGSFSRWQGTDKESIASGSRRGEAVRKGNEGYNDINCCWKSRII